MKSLKLKLSYATLLGVTLSAGCASKVLILQTPVVSMKKNSVESGSQLQEGEALAINWCTNEPPVVENKDGSKLYGMIDQVIYKAHKETKSDFFLNTKFYTLNNCIEMQANQAVVKTSTVKR